MQTVTRKAVRMRSIGWLLATLAVVPALAAQDVTLSVGRPEDVGLSSGALAGGVALYKEAVERGDLVGAVLLVAKNGKVVLHEAVGWKNLEAKQPMEKNTMFRMASNTKPVIGTAVGILVDRGKLRYSDLVRQYIASFDNYRAGFMQVGQLLSHTSGFRIPTLFLEPYGANPTLQSEVARYGPIGAVERAGLFSYSNPGYNTLGALIEIQSGKPLEVMLKENIYQPLGMVDSYHLELNDKLDRKLNRMGAVYYERKNGTWTAGWKPGDAPQVPFVRASGGMISTAWDYAIFCQMYLNKGVYGGKRILSPETVAMLTSEKVKLGDAMPASYGTGYGYGWLTTAEDGGYNHGGSDGTWSWVSPKDQLIVIVLTQTPAGKNPSARFRKIIAAAANEETP